MMGLGHFIVFGVCFVWNAFLRTLIRRFLSLSLSLPSPSLSLSLSPSPLPLILPLSPPFSLPPLSLPLSLSLSPPLSLSFSLGVGGVFCIMQKNGALFA